ncbi:hypothetical protein IscW_ISCW007445, partial [Ixodes scapularis]
RWSSNPRVQSETCQEPRRKASTTEAAEDGSLFTRPCSQPASSHKEGLTFRGLRAYAIRCRRVRVLVDKHRQRDAADQEHRLRRHKGRRRTRKEERTTKDSDEERRAAALREGPRGRHGQEDQPEALPGGAGRRQPVATKHDECTARCRSVRESRRHPRAAAESRTIRKQAPPLAHAP